MKIGILAVQGDFEKHAKRISELGKTYKFVRHSDDLKSLSGLIVPGGESTAMLRLLDRAFAESIRESVRDGLPSFCTCAGLILFAKHVTNPTQESFRLLDVDVTRNAYGRQLESFIEPNLHWTKVGGEMLLNLPNSEKRALQPFEGVFIRAPKISRVGDRVLILVKHDNDPVFVQERNVFALTFHPELSENAHIVHELFLNYI